MLQYAPREACCKVNSRTSFVVATTASAAALARNISIEDAHDCFGYTLGLQWWVVSGGQREGFRPFFKLCTIPKAMPEIQREQTEKKGFREQACLVLGMAFNVGVFYCEFGIRTTELGGSEGWYRIY